MEVERSWTAWSRSTTWPPVPGSDVAGRRKQLAAAPATHHAAGARPGHRPQEVTPPEGGSGWQQAAATATHRQEHGSRTRCPLDSSRVVQQAQVRQSSPRSTGGRPQAVTRLLEPTQRGSSGRVFGNPQPVLGHIGAQQAISSAALHMVWGRTAKLQSCARFGSIHACWLCSSMPGSSSSAAIVASQGRR